VSPNTQSRRHRILELIHAQGFCSVVSLAETLGVSDVTIRSDLRSLEQETKISRVHGGAVLTNEPRSRNFLARAHVNEDKKRWIARHAAELVEDFDSIILDASTTAYHLAEYLSPRQGLTVFTNGVEVAYRLAQNAVTQTTVDDVALNRAVIAGTDHTFCTRRPALDGCGTRVHTIPESLATSMPATRATSSTGSSTCSASCSATTGLTFLRVGVR